MRFLSMALVAGCATVPRPDPPDLKEALKHADRLFPAFQRLVRDAYYGKAYDCLSPNAKKALSYEQFYLAFTAYGASRRLIASAQVHGVDPEQGRLRICSPEFGVGRDVRLARFLGLFVLDFNPEDVEYFKSRALEWHRLQVRRADGWHYVYPPDWRYAPLEPSCPCGK